VTFDYERKQVWLEPSSRYATRDGFSLVGVQLAQQGDAIVALQVLPGSAGADAGVRVGDVVTAIDGRPIAAWTLDAINAVFEDGKPGAKHRITIARDGRKKTVTVVLKEIV